MMGALGSHLKIAKIQTALAAVSIAGLIGCAPLPQQGGPTPLGFSTEETAQPVNLFSDACLATLPRFDGFDRAVAQEGLSLVTEDGGNRLFASDAQKRLIAVDSVVNGRAACGVSFLSSANPNEVGRQFLQTAQQRTGGPAKEQFDNSYFQYAVHLQNESVMTHDARRSGRQVRHIVLITPPVPRDAVASYLSD